MSWQTVYRLSHRRRIPGVGIARPGPKTSQVGSPLDFVDRDEALALFDQWRREFAEMYEPGPDAEYQLVLETALVRP